MFQRQIQGRLSIIKSPLLDMQRGLVHGFSTRGGGYSTGCFSSLNMGFTGGDNPMHVRQNRLLFSTTLGIAPERVVCGYQVHGTHIAKISNAEMGKGFLDAATALPETDGLVTNQRGIALMTLYADCVPILFYEPEQHVIGVCHCGWKGTVGKLATKMADMMEQEFQCNRKQIYTAIGPSISRAAYEVDISVLEQFRAAFPFADQIITPVDDTHGKIDLWEANRLQLLEAGLQDHHIDISELCTYQHHQTFFSHRADQGKTGRNAAMLMML